MKAKYASCVLYVEGPIWSSTLRGEAHMSVSNLALCVANSLRINDSSAGVTRNTRSWSGYAFVGHKHKAFGYSCRMDNWKRTTYLTKVRRLTTGPSAIKATWLGQHPPMLLWEHWKPETCLVQPSKFLELELLVRTKFVLTRSSSHIANLCSVNFGIEILYNIKLL